MTIKQPDISGSEYVPTTMGGDTGPAHGYSDPPRPGHRLVELSDAEWDAYRDFKIEVLRGHSDMQRIRIASAGIALADAILEESK